ncbi:MAG: ABC transporter permease [Pyrinomonadaceae bacterium MAG19_C2-C3]|nr:ABC transporter permease [Pyrinomonadaceae bacterium MAG19_C2-C3]
MNLNPELTRALRTTLPARRAFFIFAATLALVLIGGGLVWNGYQVPQNLNPNQMAYHNEADQLRWAGRDMREILEVILFGLFFIIAPATAALTFVQEKLRGTYIFQQMMLLAPARLATGKFIGSGLLTYFIAAIVFPFYIVAAVVGEQSIIEIVRISLLLIIGGLSCQAVGLLISAVVAGYGEKMSRGSLLIAPVVAFASAVAAISVRPYCLSSYGYVKGEYGIGSLYTWDFYGVPLPYFTMILALFAFVGAWAFVGTIRRINENQLVPVSPRPVWLFIVSAQFILVGLLWGWGANAKPLQSLNQFIMLNWLALSILAAAIAVTRGNLRELLSATTHRDANQILRQRNITDAAKTFAVWLVSSLVGLVALWYSFHVQLVGFPANLALTAQLAPIVLSFILAVVTVAALVQLCALYRFRLGAWSGILFAVLFYLITGVAGAMHTSPRNTFSLINPIHFTEQLCKDDAFLIREHDLERV